MFLEGGADSLSMLFPAGHRSTPPPAARAAGRRRHAFSEDPSLRWHPSLAPLAELHGEGKVTVLPAVGYTNADQSHFTSRHYWEVGATEAGLRTGWLGRYLDVAGAMDNPLQGLALSDSLQPALASARVPRGRVPGGRLRLLGERRLGRRGGPDARRAGDFTGGTDPAAKKVAR